MPATRLIAVHDAVELAELLERNRPFLAPWEPIRPDEYFTPRGQRHAIKEALAQHDEGLAVPHVILDRDKIVGRVTLTSVVRGAFQSCERNGFIRFGVAPAYLKIAGRWQDHALYQVLNPNT